MLIKYEVDYNGFVWAVISKANNTFDHYFLGNSNVNARKTIMYTLLSNYNK